MSDPLIIAGREFRSRLFMGTAGAPNARRQSLCLGLWSCCRATWGGRTMDLRTIYIIIGAVIVLVVIGYATGWFGGSAPPPAATAPAPAQ